MQKKTIAVTEETKAKLRNLKVHTRQSYNEVIEQLLGIKEGV